VLYRDTSSRLAAICTALDMEPTILILSPILMPIIKWAAETARTTATDHISLDLCEGPPCAS